MKSKSRYYELTVTVKYTPDPDFSPKDEDIMKDILNDCVSQMAYDVVEGMATIVRAKAPKKIPKVVRPKRATSPTS